MVLARGAVVIGLLLLWVFCILDARAADPARVRTLPKPLWQLLVLVPVLGSVLWLMAGRPARVVRRGPAPGREGVPPEYDRPGRAVASNPDDDAAFLEQVRRRAEEQRRKATEEQHRKAEEDRRRRDGEDPAQG